MPESMNVDHELTSWIENTMGFLEAAKEKLDPKNDVFEFEIEQGKEERLCICAGFLSAAVFELNGTIETLCEKYPDMVKEYPEIYQLFRLYRDLSQVFEPPEVR